MIKLMAAGFAVDRIEKAKAFRQVTDSRVEHVVHVRSYSGDVLCALRVWLAIDRSKSSGDGARDRGHGGTDFL